MNEEILNTVHSMFGKNVNIVDCQTNSSIVQEEVLLINGVEIKINGDMTNEADAIKNALLDGQIPSVELLNQLLYQAGLAQQPIELETALSVQSSLKTTEDVRVSKKGEILNEKTTETKEDYIYNSKESQILQPLLSKKLQNEKNFLKANHSNHSSSPLNKSSTVTLKSSSSSSASSMASSNANKSKNNKNSYMKLADQECLSDDLEEKTNSCSTFGVPSSLDKSQSNVSSNMSNCSTYTFSNPTLASASTTTVSE